MVKGIDKEALKAKTKVIPNQMMAVKKRLRKSGS